MGRHASKVFQSTACLCLLLDRVRFTVLEELVDLAVRAPGHVLSHRLCVAFQHAGVLCLHALRLNIYLRQSGRKMEVLVRFPLLLKSECLLCLWLSFLNRFLTLDIEQRSHLQFLGCNRVILGR